MSTRTKTNTDLRTIPGVGPSIEIDLVDLGIRAVQELKGRNPDQLYDDLCRLRGERIDDRLVATVDAPTGRAAITVDDTGENSIVVVPGANELVTLVELPTTAVVLGQLEVPLAVVTSGAVTPSRQALPGSVNRGIGSRASRASWASSAAISFSRRSSFSRVRASTAAWTSNSSRVTRSSRPRPGWITPPGSTTWR